MLPIVLVALAASLTNAAVDMNVDLIAAESGYHYATPVAYHAPAAHYAHGAESADYGKHAQGYGDHGYGVAAARDHYGDAAYGHKVIYWRCIARR